MSCRVCSNASDGPLVTVRGARQAGGHSFEYLFCNACGSLSIQEIPRNLHEFYQNYYSFQTLDTRLSLRRWVRRIVERCFFYRLPSCIRSQLIRLFLDKEDDFKLTSLAHLKPQKSWDILDVGSGSGDFVYSLHDLGFKKAVGIDPFLSESMRYENGAVILQSDITDVDGQYDLVTFHHSFEHLTDPAKHLERIKQLLKPTGVCLIRLPSIDCWSYKMFKENWVGIHAPYHVLLPSHMGLEMLLKSHGLRICSSKGEQIVDFFLISKENFMGISDLRQDSIRSVMAGRGDVKYSPWHCKGEMTYWRSMKKLVQKHNLCDCILHHLCISAAESSWAVPWFRDCSSRFRRSAVGGLRGLSFLPVLATGIPKHTKKEVEWNLIT